MNKICPIRDREFRLAAMASDDRTRTDDGIDLPAESKGLLGRHGDSALKVYSQADRDRLALILQGKRLGFTLSEIRELLAVPASHCAKVLPIGRRKCVDQIKLLERQRRDIERAIAELRQIYTEMLTDSGVPRPASLPGTH